ncbi:DNA polymerase III, chi subunit [Rhodoblastus acidophilus]|uniref:DNA polymerase III, chi subunit n=1 Tax=Rhodoblastus acidophilus TaxID=1074 RepID=A0A212PVP6_RHOAC|nr:DNA polymerase III subunit chi [Rhodoblastus acidophilus]MCW2316751.1 DNA polymerase-3 subunit chi [Rhodoblastus acidophilus]PPQ37862.1 DNA polymerase III subunit chi [Rhodoblastus acidophilus]RAI16590.1 DNA polymerase III subunit chi [Rhodoblastus acidophilus]SNB50948.1 DNA polymerase III, chi subunit [Rhodoblastus acidophilus]
MTEVWFYQLQRRRLEQALPSLVERVRQRGWRAVLQAATPERLAAIDDLLWTYAEDSFLPHGAAKDGDPELQPVWLTLGADNPNDAQVRFLLEGVAAAPFVEQGYQRLIILFDGRDPGFLDDARAQWKDLRRIGVAPAYWAETEEGGWRKQA